MAIADNAAWYRKYRPKNFSDYMGDEIKTVVENRFKDRTMLPQVIGIYGTRGCGKTTFARIVSKYYLCESPINGEPCETCEVCTQINEVLIDGETGVEVPGVVEIDATVANGKDAIQEIIEDAIIPPIYTKYKVLVIDECHMITKQAQNSLLKIIEDIPKHLIVVFATTDWDLVLSTIKSRCQLKLEVKKKTVEELADRLMYIAEKEGLHTSKEALKIIAKKGDRVPRECINLLEDIAKSYGNTVTVDTVRARTGDVASEVYMSYIKAANTGLEDILQFNKTLKSMDISASAFISGLTRYVLDCLYVRHAINMDDYPTEYVKQVKKLFDRYKSSEFDTLLQVIEHASKMLGNDENRNELVITTTALRIGKIGLLANGLAGESIQAEKENKQSIKEYKKQADMELENQFEKVQTYNTTGSTLASLMSGAAEVTSAKGVVIDGRKAVKKQTTEEGFFTPDMLNSMLDN